MTSTAARQQRRALALLIFLLLAVLASVRALAPPAAVPADAPPIIFSSGRAMVHLRQIAVRPHPAGSPDNARVRRYLVERLQALGVRPTLQAAQITAARRHVPDALGTPRRRRGSKTRAGDKL